jgi:cell division control protein 6
VNRARELGYEPLTQRRVSEIISQLDMMGLVLAEVVNRGRRGVTKMIKVKPDIVKNIEEALKDLG